MDRCGDHFGSILRTRAVRFGGRGELGADLLLGCFDLSASGVSGHGTGSCVRVLAAHFRSGSSARQWAVFEAPRRDVLRGIRC
jgi:hypothetical protein